MQRAGSGSFPLLAFQLLEVLVGIHQPHYLAWLRYFDKIAHCDLFILLDDVDFTRNGWQNRNKIKTSQGAQILTAPVRHKLGQKICEVELDGGPWARKHASTIAQSYAAAAHFASYKEELAEFYQRPWKTLVELNRAHIEWQMRALGIDVPLVWSSQLGVESAASERLVRLIQAVGGDAYLSGRHALGEYLDPQLFAREGVELWIVDWDCPEYRQLHSKQGFIKDLATLDVIFNHGPEAMEIVKQGSRTYKYA